MLSANKTSWHNPTFQPCIGPATPGARTNLHFSGGNEELNATGSLERAAHSTSLSNILRHEPAASSFEAPEHLGWWQSTTDEHAGPSEPAASAAAENMRHEARQDATFMKGPTQHGPFSVRLLAHVRRLGGVAGGSRAHHEQRGPSQRLEAWILVSLKSVSRTGGYIPPVTGRCPAPSTPSRQHGPCEPELPN